MSIRREHLTVGLLLLLVLFNLWMIGFGKQPWVISSINIFFHEAGHWIFAMFGRFVGVLGGTLGELLVPSIFIIYFWKQENLPGQVFGIWWLTTAIYSVSIYVADARAQVLPLIGGPGGHDWFYLLGRTRLLDYDIMISKFLIIAALSLTMYMVVLIYRYYQLTRGKIIS